MNNHLGKYFRARRLELGLGLGQVARLLGYRNVSKGANKVNWFEQNGSIRNDLLQKLMRVLDIEQSAVVNLATQDRDEYLREWETWVNEPVPIRIVVRCLPGFMGTVRLPGDVTTPDQAIAYGQALAARVHKKVFVILSRREMVGITEKGEINGHFHATPDSDPTPSMHLGRAKFLFNVVNIGNPEPFEQ